MPMNPMEMLVAVYPTRAAADETLDTLGQMDRDHVIRLLDAAIVSKTEDGKVKVEELHEITTKRAMLRGAAVGAILGIIFPPSILATALVGGGAGGLIKKLRHREVNLDDAEAVTANLKPDEVALLVLIEATWVERLERAMVGYDRVFHQVLKTRSAAILGADPVTGEIDVVAFDQSDVLTEEPVAAPIGGSDG